MNTSRVVVVVAHLIGDVNAAVTEFFAGPIQQSRPAMGARQSVFHVAEAGADGLPAGEILAVEELLPILRRQIRLRKNRRRQKQRGKNKLATRSRA
jgi:hypothetical protein